MEQAIKVRTLDGLYSTFEQKKKGSITAGKLADFAVLSDDILSVPAERLLTTTALATYVGGKLVYRRGRP